jgi:heavy metal efflux system protein
LYIMFEKGISLKKKKPITATIILFVLLFTIQNTKAQSPIALKAATDTALKNNLSVKNEKLRAEYQQKLIKTAKIIPLTNVFGEFGQINSFYVDSKVGLSQTISFTKVYASQKSLLTEEYKSSVLNVGMKEAVLKKQVAQVYYSLLYLQEKKKLLQKNDSLFAEFLRKATLRFNKGESNILEKATAENQRGQIGLQLSQLQQDMELLQIQFHLLLNTNTVFVPDEKEFKMNITGNADTSMLQAHPAMQYLKQQQQIATAATQVEKSKLLPDLTFGYNIMGMKGTGANNKTYNSVPQFQSVQIGLGIPIFASGQKAKINAAKTNEVVIANEYEVNLKNFETTYKTAVTQYQKYSETIQYFETTALKNADIITSTANKQFINGDINYLEWVLLVNQAVSIQSDYIEAVKNRNITTIEINSFINK